MSKKGFVKAFPFLLLLATASVGIVLFNWFLQNKNVLIISHDSGIYTEGFYLSAKTLQPATIYYTLDGSMPDVESDVTFQYEAPFWVPIEDATSAYSIRFFCVFEDGSSSPVYNREFLLEKSGAGRFTTQYIVSITGDEDALFGYEEGIFVRGRQFDEYMVANPDTDILSEIIPANYYSDTEVPVHVAIFTRSGQEVISKNCGLRIYGNVTRAKNQKSFRLYARDIYDGVNEFQYPFISELVAEGSGQVIDEYQRLSFHNSGNDNGYAFVRNALTGKLAYQAGYGDVLHSRSAVVFINGTYQGMYWLQNTYDDKYFKEKYGDYTGEMVVCEGQLNRVVSAKEETPASNQCMAEYNAFCEWVASADLTLDENWEIVENTLDVSSFAKYIAMEYYVGNMDWPSNNVKVYRYMPLEGPKGYVEGTVFDGRYRYLLFDTDYAFGLKFQDRFGLDATSWRLPEFCNLSGENNLFACLMQREEFRQEFIHTVLVLSKGVFGKENVSQVLSEFCLQKDAELQYAYGQTNLYKGSLWESDDRNFAHVAKGHEYIIEYAEKRPQAVLEEMQMVLKTGEVLDVCLSMEEDGFFVVHGMDVGNYYRGHCYEDVPMEISCEFPAGTEVTGYKVNEQYVAGEVLCILPSEWLQTGSELNIQPVVKTSPKEQLSVVAYDIDGSEDYVVLENTGNVTLNLADYAISDSMETSKGRLPDKLLAPGERFYVYGKRYAGNMQENSIMVSFSWNDEETVVLSNVNIGIID